MDMEAEYRKRRGWNSGPVSDQKDPGRPNRGVDLSLGQTQVPAIF